MRRELTARQREVLVAVRELAMENVARASAGLAMLSAWRAHGLCVVILIFSSGTV
jgi:hypothetical protein